MSDENGSDGATELVTEDEALSVLLDADIDKVMARARPDHRGGPLLREALHALAAPAVVHRGLRLHRGREAVGRPATLMTEDEREFMLFGFSQFFLGEERVTVELLPFAIAAPTHEAQAFLTTQISDEAKHMVFFDRFYREVLGMEAETLGEMLGPQRTRRQREVGGALRRDPPRLRRAAAQGPHRLRARWCAGSPST